MRGYVATTDFSWFTFLREKQPLDEVNFWQPSAHGFNAPPGTPFFFKLKAPHYAIGGFGIFARYDAATPKLAWEAFGEKNGARTFEEMRTRVAGYAAVPGKSGHRIGCIMVAQPVFFPDGDWIEQPKDWKKNVVSGAGYDLAEGEGRRIWEACLARASGLHQAAADERNVIPVPWAADRSRFGSPQLIRPRLGQGTFRVAVTAAYGGACAVSGEHSLPALEAAHIRPYTREGTHDVSNGLLLRADIHRLFDDGYVTVTPDFRFLVSQRLEQEFQNGKVYYSQNRRPLMIPKNKRDHPDTDLLRWHNENVFEKDAA